MPRHEAQSYRARDRQLVARLILTDCTGGGRWHDLPAYAELAGRARPTASVPLPVFASRWLSVPPVVSLARTCYNRPNAASRRRPPMNVTVLGAGMVGSAIARDLAGDAGLRVTAVDRDAAALQRLAARAPVDTAAADLSDPAVVDGGRLRGRPGGLRRARLHGLPYPGGRDRGRPERGGHLLLPGGRLPAGRSRPREGGHRRGGLRRGAGPLQHHGGPGREPDGPGRELCLLRGRPAGGAALALRVQGRLLARRRHRGVHPPGAAGGARAGGRPARPLRGRADGFPGHRHAGGLQHRRPAHPAAARWPCPT